VRFVEGLVNDGLNIAGVYPNVLTVLPGTLLARALASDGAGLDFYRVPRTAEFEDMEDGAVGHNFATLGLDGEEALRTAVVQASNHLSSLSGHRRAPWLPSSTPERTAR